MKKFKWLIALLLIFVMTMPMFACGPRGEKIDKTKTQIYVGNYDGGFGSEWISQLKIRFEEAYKDVSFEEGKTGAQVIIDNNKSLYYAGDMIDTLPTSDQEVFFTSGEEFYEFTSENMLLDITDMVEEKLTKYGESESIADKINLDRLPYCKASDGKYYAIPHFDGPQGIVYDKDLFSDKKLYIAKNGAPSERLQEGGSFTTYKWTDGLDKDNVSAGPDGEYGTADDGLPATYEEFFELCALMRKKNITPFSWTGKYVGNYSLMLYKYAMTDYHGKDEISLQFNAGSVEGKNTTKLVKFENGVPVIDENGYAVLEDTDTVINLDNYSELARQPGRYYALKLWEEIIKNKDYTMESVNTGQSHVQAQADYLESKFTDEPIAFILEGTWWEHEANVSGAVSALVEVYGDEVDPANRNFGFFPLPKATEDKIGEKATLYKEGSYAFINGNIKEHKKKIAKTFLQFAYTDESLNYQTQYAGIKGGVDYDITDETLSKVTPFCRDVIEFEMRADSAYRVIPTKEIKTAIEDKEYALERTQSIVNGLDQTGFFYPMLGTSKTSGLSAKEYMAAAYTKLTSLN